MAAREGASLAQRVQAELALIRDNVMGVHGSLVATNDGFLVAHDVPGLAATEIAALAATTRALATRATLAAGRGQFREALTRGSLGYLAVYAAGDNAVVGVVGTSELNVAMLHYQAREIVDRIAAHSAEFGTWLPPAAARSGAAGASPGDGPAGRPDRAAPLPKRRTVTGQRRAAR
jgi:uncharacterized protein